MVGKLVFGEHLSTQWCLGSALMVLGLVILHKGASQVPDVGQGDSQLHSQQQSVKLKKQ